MKSSSPRPSHQRTSRSQPGRSRSASSQSARTRQASRERAAAKGETVEEEVEISAIGSRGDGLALAADGTHLFVPYSTAGDRWRVAIRQDAQALARGEGLRGEPVELLAAGPDRAEPACRHFGRCGGCTLQHLTAEAYEGWKVNQVRSALNRVGLDEVPVERLVTCQPGSRRRARLAALKRGGKVWLGFNERMSHRLVDVEDCPVLTPRLMALVAPLRQMLVGLLPDGGDCDVMLADLAGGIDMLLIGPKRLGAGERDQLIGFAMTEVARISWRASDSSGIEPVASRRPVMVEFDGLAVQPPPGTFLQASAEGEAALVSAVLAAINERVAAGKPVRRIADLFAGLGTFSVPLSRIAAVHAVDGESPPLSALNKAAGALRLVTEPRDLFETPLTVKELSRFDAVVFDPPRAGATAQAAMLAQSRVPLVIGVSCNPSSFVRDARVLVDGGYRLVSVTPVDQFLWSTHIELVGVFQRQG